MTSSHLAAVSTLRAGTMQQQSSNRHRKFRVSPTRPRPEVQDSRNPYSKCHFYIFSYTSFTVRRHIETGCEPYLSSPNNNSSNTEELQLDKDRERTRSKYHVDER